MHALLGLVYVCVNVYSSCSVHRVCVGVLGGGDTNKADRYATASLRVIQLPSTPR